ISLSLYGTSYQSDQFFVEGIMTFGQNDFDQKRNVNYTLAGTTVNQVASSDYDGDQFSLALGGGYHFQYNEMTLTTTGRVEYVDTTVDSYNESMSNPNSDGGGWAVALDEQNMDSLTLTLGVDASYALSRSWGILSPQASIEWVHEFEDDSRLISANFVGDPTQEKFLLPTDSVDSDYFNLRLGVSGQFATGGSAYVYYQKLLGYDDLDVDSIGLGFRWAF
ncbi:autotransporter outer membrane beta-barrel domain-containing protein, partial [Motiliproteus sp. MSK22-1]|uniref:autotransporter outer membrane beta-barrel domain-containing protein n=1 Tax=Motiliproteus sp. MSK22-1 TaxID=1897630 RepID=UPI0013010D0F